MTDEQKNRQTHEGREVIYASLSRLFLETPSNKTYEILNVLMPGLECMKDGGGVISEGVNGLIAFMNTRSGKTSGELKDYDLDTLRGYTRVFCLTDSVPVSESYYTSVDKLVMQEARDEVLTLYKNSGFKIESESNEPEDHIAYELMYMSYLSNVAKKEAANSSEEKLGKILELQMNFIKQHLKRWQGDFIDRLSQFTESSRLYLPLAKFMYGYILEDATFLEAK